MLQPCANSWARLKANSTVAKYLVTDQDGAGGKDPGTKTQLPIDDIKADKIENVVCTCQQIQIPE